MCVWAINHMRLTEISANNCEESELAGMCVRGVANQMRGRIVPVENV